MSKLNIAIDDSLGDYGTGGGGAAANTLLLETSDNFLLETGDLIVLESGT